MSKMNITDLTNDSFLVDVSLDEAAEINGGNGWYPNLFSDLFYGSLGSNSVSSHYLRQNQNRYTPEKTLVNGINSNSLAAFDRRIFGVLSYQQYI